jgi:uncharacterized protein (TIGR02284 family)
MPAGFTLSEGSHPYRSPLMATAVGTEDKIKNLLGDLIQLDHDAVLAYDAAIERLGNANHRAALTKFRLDHLRHVEELGAALAALGRQPPGEGNMKSWLTQGKVVLGGLIGDKAILQAMKTSEDDTQTADQRAVQHRNASAELRANLERGLADERRHRDWLVETIAKF